MVGLNFRYGAADHRGTPLLRRLGSVVRPTPRDRAIQGDAMQRWEYTELVWVEDTRLPEMGPGGGEPSRDKGILWFSHRKGSEEIDNLRTAMRRIGDEGWELVAVNVMQAGVFGTRRYTFKRSVAGGKQTGSASPSSLTSPA
jgi:hypothetical protein